MKDVFWVKEIENLHLEHFFLILYVEFDVLHDYVHVDDDDELQPLKNIENRAKKPTINPNFFCNSIECIFFDKWTIMLVINFSWCCHCSCFSISTYCWRTHHIVFSKNKDFIRLFNEINVRNDNKHWRKKWILGKFKGFYWR